MFKKLILGAAAAAFAMLCALTALPTHAQGDNLLINPGMEKPYEGQGAADLTAPNGWRVWYSGVAPVSFPHVDASQIHGGQAAWNQNRGFQVFTAGGYQQVTGIRPGSIMRGSVYGLVYTCNDGTSSCINGSGQRISDRVANASIRVGIDPSGGTDPNSTLIVWSPLSAAYDSWTSISVDATACNITVTLFLYATQGLPLALNNVYWDDAFLRIQQPGTGGNVTCANPAPGGTPGAAGATAAPPTQAFAPFVQKQQGEVQADGTIVHIVKTGDTLAAIAVAYGISFDQIRDLNGFKPGEGGYLQIGQKIIVGKAQPGTLTETPAAGSTASILKVTATSLPTLAASNATSIVLAFTQQAPLAPPTAQGAIIIPTVTPIRRTATPAIIIPTATKAAQSASGTPAVTAIAQAPQRTIEPAQVVENVVVLLLRAWLSTLAAG